MSEAAPGHGMPGLGARYLATVLKVFRAQKGLADRAVAQVADEALDRAPGPDANSIAVLMRHLAGNMVSRWTHFLTSDGEKPWRNRDGEFDHVAVSRATLLEGWERGWNTLFAAVEALGPQDLERSVTIRSEPHSVVEALERQVSHYGYHVGQIVYVARLSAGASWTSLSIPRGGSAEHDRRMGHRPA